MSKLRCYERNNGRDGIINLVKYSRKLRKGNSAVADNSISKDILVPKHLVPVQEKWNSLGLSKIRDIKGNRLKLLNARIKEYGIEQVLEAIENINYSPFLKGQNKTGWVIVFDWFIKPNNFVKVLEGNYKDKDSANGNYTSNNKKRLNKSSERAGMSSAEIEESLINNF